MDEHLAGFIASSDLTVVMTYANWRLSAEMRLFSRKTEIHEQTKDGWKVDEEADGKINCEHLTFVFVC